MAAVLTTPSAPEASHDIPCAFWDAIFGAVQLVEGFVISPKIIGDRVGLHPLTIILALMIGTTLMGGIIGGILAIPLTAALRVLMFRYVWKRQQEASATAPVTESVGRTAG